LQKLDAEQERKRAAKPKNNGEDDEEEDDGDICQRVDDEDEEFDVPGEAEGDVLRERLRKMLATVHDEEEDYEEED